MKGSTMNAFQNLVPDFPLPPSAQSMNASVAAITARDNSLFASHALQSQAQGFSILDDNVYDAFNVEVSVS